MHPVDLFPGDPVEFGDLPGRHIGEVLPGAVVEPPEVRFVEEFHALHGAAEFSEHGTKLITVRLGQFRRDPVRDGERASHQSRSRQAGDEKGVETAE